MNARENQRLDSWKEIAAFFGRDERTVRRWEKERALPVYRMPGKARGSVFAFTEELSHWLKAPPENQPIAKEVEVEATAVATELEPIPVPPAPKGHSRQRIWGLAVAASFLLVLVIWAVHDRSARANNPVPVGVSPESHGSTNPESEDLYLKGRYEWNKRNPESLKRALDLFTQAIVHDPRNARAYAGMAETYNLLREYSDMPEREAYTRAIVAARKAIELDPSLPEAHRALAFGMFNWEWDVEGSEKEFQRAIALAPGDAVAHHWYATSLLVLGRVHDARVEVERARQLDPSSSSIAADRAVILYFDGNKEEAISILKQMEQSEPAFRSPHWYMANFDLMSKDYPGFLHESKINCELQQNQAGLKIVSEAQKGFDQGGAPAMFTALLKYQKIYYAQGLFSDYEMAETLALMDRKKEALDHLQNAYDNHDPRLIGTRNEMFFLSLRREPGFEKLLAELHLPPI
jgi:Tfp pilus assembly protein PilF